MQITQLQSSENTQREAWDSFVQNHPHGSVHQLLEWAQFQSKSGTREKFWILAGQKEETQANKSAIQCGTLILRQDLPLGLCWLYCPGGPLLDWNNQEEVKTLFAAIQKLAKQQKAVFVRFDPRQEAKTSVPVPQTQKTLGQNSSHSSKNIEQFFSLIKAKKAHSYYQPESTLLIDLAPSEEEILAAMKPKGRYNIKVAKKHAVHVRESSEKTLQKDLQSFYNLLKTTAKRDRFHIHPLAFYEQFMEQLGPKRTRLYMAEYKPQDQSHPVLLSAAIVTYFEGTATYYFGASSNEYRSTMAPYLLHWEIMRAAKKDGYKTYDLFGIAPADAKNHPWQKVTEFKMKFGGRRLDYTPAHEIIYRPIWLLIIRVVKRLAPQVNHWLNQLRK